MYLSRRVHYLFELLKLSYNRKYKLPTGNERKIKKISQNFDSKTNNSTYYLRLPQFR